MQERLKGEYNFLASAAEVQKRFNEHKIERPFSMIGWELKDRQISAKTVYCIRKGCYRYDAKELFYESYEYPTDEGMQREKDGKLFRLYKIYRMYPLPYEVPPADGVNTVWATFNTNRKATGFTYRVHNGLAFTKALRDRHFPERVVRLVELLCMAFPDNTIGFQDKLSVNKYGYYVQFYPTLSDMGLPKHTVDDRDYRLDPELGKYIKRSEEDERHLFSASE